MLSTILRSFSTKRAPTIFEYFSSATPVQLAGIIKANKHMLHERDTHGNTLMHLAVKHGRDDLIPTLVHSGAHLLEAPNDQGHTPLKFAISGYHYPSIYALYKHGASIIACGQLTGQEELNLQLGQYWDHHNKDRATANLADALFKLKIPFSEITRRIQEGTYSQDEVVQTLYRCLSTNKYSATIALLQNLDEDVFNQFKFDLFDFALRHGTQKGLNALAERGMVGDPANMRTDRDYYLTADARLHAKQKGLLIQFSNLYIKEDSELDSKLNHDLTAKAAAKKTNKPS
jgi:ankyrin repeat protein